MENILLDSDVLKKRAHHAEWMRGWRKKNIKGVRVRQRSVKDKLKSGPCVDCGKTFPSVAMEFDHLRDKTFKMSHNAYRAVSKIVEEASKCDVVCVLCHRERTHSRYVYADSKTSVAKRAIQIKVNALKSGPCSLCGEKYNPWQMDFDHIDPTTKIDKICNLVHRRASWAQIVEEIAKCRLLCALCHRLHTEGVKWPM